MYIKPIENIEYILLYNPTYLISMPPYFNMMYENPCDTHRLGEDLLKAEFNSFVPSELNGTFPNLSAF